MPLQPQSPLHFEEIVEMEVPLGDSQGNIYQRLFSRGFFALAISGGGIRVATFALGIVQFLAERKLLHDLDYLSTVSGGGYTGSFLSAWINRSASIEHVEEALVPPPQKPPHPAEDEAISWLRQFGKYLSPQTSLFSADTWLIGTIWSRNTLLNLILLILFLTAVLLLPWILLGLYRSSAPGIPVFFAHGLAAFGTMLAILGVSRRSGAEWFYGMASAVSIVLASILHVFATRRAGEWSYGSPDFILGLLLGLITGVSMVWESPPGPGFLVRVFLSTALGAFGLPYFGVLIGSVSQVIDGQGNSFLIPMLVPQLVTIMYCVLVTFLIGLAGWRQSDHVREWWSRVGAWMAIFGFGGLLLAGISIAGPALFFFVYSHWSLLIPTGGFWALATAAGVLIGRSPATSGDEPAKRGILDRLLPFAPVIFMAGFITLGATAVYLSLFAWEGRTALIPKGLAATVCIQDCEKVYITPSLAEFWTTVWTGYAGVVNHLEGPGRPLLGLLIASGLFVLFSRLFDINEFSLHQFYRTRLVRAYQGASRCGVRNSDSFTNIDPDDDLPIQNLKTKSGTHTGPVHLVNTAVNLNLANTGLDERRAASFVFTPYACGYSLPFGGPDCFRAYSTADSDFRLGTPITISGAAASPNMGYHSSAPVAFLMTLFNVRLGFWIYNTAEGVSRLAPVLMRWLPSWLHKIFYLEKSGLWSPRGPLFGTVYYLSELFGIADRNRKYVYLSDGGHFENLAVYELLRRRARFIICIDGEEDAGMKFEGLGGLIRKARSDMGVEITIDTSSIEERSAEGWSQRHCAIASIHYPEHDSPKATMLYIKLSVTGDEPVDIIHYRKQNPAFPHQSTGDQFFTESQFESYRALGYHIAESTFRPIAIGKYDAGPPEDRIPGIFNDLQRFWTGVPRNLTNNSARNTEQLIALLEQLRKDSDLWFLNAQFDSEWAVASNAVAIPNADPAYTKAFYFCQQLIQLMENVYVDLDLEANYNHPVFDGWTEQFRRWARSAMFQHTYQKTSTTFGPLFRSFYERRIQPRA